MIFLNKSLWIDEGYSNITSLLISQTGTPLYESGYWDGAYLLFHYLQAGIFYLFGYSPEISRILPILFGIISLYLIYKIADRVFGRYAGILSVILCILSYQYLVMHLQARYYGLMTLLFLFTIWQLLSVMNNRISWKNCYILLTFVIISLSFHVYLYVLVPIVLLGGIIAYGPKIVNTDKTSILQSLTNNWGKSTVFATYGLFILLLGYYLNPGVIPSNVSDTIALSRFDYAVRYAWFFRSEFGVLGIMFFGSLLFWQKFKNGKLVLILLFSFFFPYLVIAKQVFMVANRYVYFLIPIFIILAAGFITFSIAYLKNRYLKYFISFVYITGIFITFHTWIGSTFPLLMNDRFAPEPDYKSAYSFIQNTFKTNTGYSLISSFPHMDKLYLSKSDGYIYIDETGIGILPEKNFYIKNGRNIFTNAPVILNLNDLKKYESNHTVIILDQLSYNRLLNSDILTYIESSYKKVFEIMEGNFFIKVYYRDLE